MNLARMVPAFVKPVLSPPYRLACSCIRRITQRHRSLADTHSYWEKPSDGANAPDRYVLPDERSRFLLDLVKKYVQPDARILEIGCNVGRNLAHLHSAGFTNLVSVEISEQALELLRKTYPELASTTKLINLPIEQAIVEFEAGEFDLVFTMAVLEHVHKESKWIFGEIVRITKGHLITIEDEEGVSWRHFPRNYRKIFERLGFKQIEELNCAEQGLKLPDSLEARVFGRADVRR